MWLALPAKEHGFAKTQVVLRFVYVSIFTMISRCLNGLNICQIEGLWTVSIHMKKNNVTLFRIGQVIPGVSYVKEKTY